MSDRAGSDGLWATGRSVSPCVCGDTLCSVPHSRSSVSQSVQRARQGRRGAPPGGDGCLGRAEVPQRRGRWDPIAVGTELCRAWRGQLNVCGLVSGAPGRRFTYAPNNKHRTAQTHTPGIARGADLPRYEPGPSRAGGDSKSRAPASPRGSEVALAFSFQGDCLASSAG